MGDVQELRLVLTVSDFEAAVALYRDALGLPEETVAAAVTTPWNERNVRMRDPEGMQLTLFTTRG